MIITQRGIQRVIFYTDRVCILGKYVLTRDSNCLFISGVLTADITNGKINYATRLKYNRSMRRRNAHIIDYQGFGIICHFSSWKRLGNSLYSKSLLTIQFKK